MSTRKFSRVEFNVMATVSTGGRSFQGKVSNLSMNGLLLDTDEKLQMGEVVDITISLPGTEPEIAVAFTGRVCRITDSDIAFRFQMIDLDSYTHLRNIISYNMADAEKVMDEIFSDIDEKIASGAVERGDVTETP